MNHLQVLNNLLTQVPTDPEPDGLAIVLTDGELGLGWTISHIKEDPASASFYKDSRNKFFSQQEIFELMKKTSHCTIHVIATYKERPEIKVNQHTTLNDLGDYWRLILYKYSE